MKASLFALGLVALGLASAVAGCAADAEPTVDSSESAVIGSRSTATQLWALVEEGRVMFDDVTPFPSGGVEVIDSVRTESLGVVNVNALVRIPSGAVFHVVYVDGPVGSRGEDGAIFTDTRHFLVLDAAGLEHVFSKGRKTAVRGERLEQLQEVFARAPHPSSPTEPLWGENPFFALADGGEGVAFIGAFYVRTRSGAISKLSLASDDFDPLDR